MSNAYAVRPISCAHACPGLPMHRMHACMQVHRRVNCPGGCCSQPLTVCMTGVEYICRGLQGNPCGPRRRMQGVPMRQPSHAAEVPMCMHADLCIGELVQLVRFEHQAALALGERLALLIRALRGGGDMRC